MRSFEDLLDLASTHHGSAEAVLAKAANDHSAVDLVAVTDDRWLAEMTKAVFQAGFSWKVIQSKWDGFEVAFDSFDPARVGFYSDDDLARLLADKGIVRNGQKISATIQNARFVSETSKQHDGFGRFLATWPANDQAGLLAYFAKNGSRLGGSTAQYFLRFTGWDAWIASKDVCAAFVREGVLDKPVATSKRAITQIQNAFNTLQTESKHSYAVISRVLAMSVG